MLPITSVSNAFVSVFDLSPKIYTLMQEDWTAMMAAANNGRHDTVAKLLDYKANPDLQDDVRIYGIMNSLK